MRLGRLTGALGCLIQYGASVLQGLRCSPSLDGLAQHTPGPLFTGRNAASRPTREIYMAIHVVTISVLRVVLALQVSTRSSELPYSLNAADVEIQWQNGGGDGCASAHCADYRITLRGDGVVRTEDLGWGGQPPRQGIQTRSIAADEFVAVLNQLLDARFLDANADLVRLRVAAKKGDVFYFYYSGGGNDSPWVDLTLRAGSYRKTVRLHDMETTTPAALRAVRDRIRSIGGVEGERH